ncbi:PEPxxWA-CTERM sorting domain-containing protein [Sphingomonas sp. M1A8_2b]
MIDLAKIYARNHRNQQYMIIGGMMLALVGSLAPRNERALFVTGSRPTPKAFAAIAPPVAFNGLFNDLARYVPRGLRINTPRRGPRPGSVAPDAFARADPAAVTSGAIPPTSGESAPVQLALLDPTGISPAGRGITGAPLAGAGPASFGPGATGAGAATPANPTTPTTPAAGGETTTPVIPVGPVPEPATWAMMVAGFFGLGALLRRNRSAVSSIRAGRLQT